MEQANDVQEAMSRTYGVPEEVDEADLEAGQFKHSRHLLSDVRTELEALGDDLGMEADEMPSYLQESAGGSQLPDFVDEAPMESDVGAGSAVGISMLTVSRSLQPQKAGPVKAV